jgi:hypothetical protein
LATACLAARARGSLVVYDGFRTTDGYVNGQTVQSTNVTGPAGWATGTGAWTGGSSGITFQSALGLTYPTDHYAGGGAIQFAPTGSSADAARTTTHPLSTPLTLGGVNGSATAYMSFMLNIPTYDADGLAYASFVKTSSASRGLGAGVNAGELVLVGVNGGTTYLDLGTAYTAGTTYYFVVKLSDGGDAWSGKDPLEVWVNPTNVSSESAMTDSSLVHLLDTTTFDNISDGDQITNLYLDAKNFGGNSALFDEFRLGTELTNVVPEPASLTVLACGALALLSRRRSTRPGEKR